MATEDDIQTIVSIPLRLRLHSIDTSPRSTERMNIRFTITLAYACLVLWGWDFALGEGSSELTERIIPMFGIMLLAWVIHRLECMAKEQKKKQAAESGSTTEQTTTNRPNEA